MPRMVIEVPEEFTEVGKAMAGPLVALQRTASRPRWRESRGLCGN